MKELNFAIIFILGIIFGTITTAMTAFTYYNLDSEEQIITYEKEPKIVFQMDESCYDQFENTDKLHLMIDKSAE